MECNLSSTQTEAIDALADWKYEFSCSVRNNAHAIARRCGDSGEITRKHYQLAAQIALTELAVRIGEEIQNAEEKVA